jgi:TP901 family phage tail tape measure protein
LQFEGEMMKLRTQIGLTSPEIDQMRRAALSLGGQTTKAPQELAEATFFIASAGLRGAAAMDVLRSSAQLSAIGLGETKVIADLLTSAVNAYGEEALSAASASDSLVSAVRLGKLEADQLAGAMGRVLPIASAMGVSFNEVSGFMAAMSRTGTDAATGATQLRAIMVSLLKPAQQSEEALNRVGLTSGHLRNAIMEDGLWAALMQLHGAVDGNTEAFAEIFPNVRALAGVMDLLGPQLENNAQLFEQHANSTGVGAEAFAEFSVGTRAEIDRMGAAFQRMSIILGQATTGPIAVGARVMTSALTGAANAVGLMSDRAMFTEMALNDYADALSDLRRMTEGVSGAQLQAVMDSNAYESALRRVRDTAQAARSVEHDLGFEVERRGFLTKDANEFDAESIRLLELRIRNAQASLDPMRGMNAAAERYNGLAERMLGVTSDTASAMDALAESLGFTREEMDMLNQEIDENRRAQLAVIDPMYGAIRAQRDYREALDELIRVQGDAASTSDELVDAVFDVMMAEVERQAAMDAAGLVTEGFVGTLNRTIEAFGLEEAQVRELLEALGEYGIALETLDGTTIQTTHIHTVQTVGDTLGFTDPRTIGLPPATTLPRTPSAPPAPRRPTAAEDARRAAELLMPRARGGPVMPGQMYVVGEEGPELFSPAVAGAIIPAGPTAQALSSGGGITIQSYNTYRSADDQALLSMLEMAQQAGRL